MTIKEVELKTGLTRANIRYYEDQGFFSAARGENGYRNYSDENIDTLLKVKLLRQLGFSLEDIHALQRGEQSLDQALEQREVGLTGDIRSLNQSLDLCREMRADGADFYTLDARRYLARLARAETVIEKDRDPVRIFPWRRFFARTLDHQICGTLLVFLLQLTVQLNRVRLSENLGAAFLMDLSTLLILAGAETWMLHGFGTTPGKALLGLKILREDGSKLSLAEAARRTGLVTLFYGIGLLLMDVGILLFWLAGTAMMIWACWQVYHEKPLPWEEGQLYLDGSTKMRAFWDNGKNFLRVAGYLAATAACIGLTVGGHYLAARPPHRGANLTAEEFVDNYNQYMNFVYGEENRSRQLTVDGTFERINHDGNNVVIDLNDLLSGDRLPAPAFRFEEEGGTLRSVTLVQQYENSEPMEEMYVVNIPYDEIYVAMRSFLYRQLGERKINTLQQEMTEGRGNLHWVGDGVSVDSTMRFSGYDSFLIEDGTLLTREGQKQSYFVEFIMTLEG